MFIRAVDVYKVDFFNRVAKININDKMMEFPINYTAANSMPPAPLRAMLIGENLETAVAVLFTENTSGVDMNKKIVSAQNNMMGG